MIGPHLYQTTLRLHHVLAAHGVPWNCGCSVGFCMEPMPQQEAAVTLSRTAISVLQCSFRAIRNLSRRAGKSSSVWESRWRTPWTVLLLVFATQSLRPNQRLPRKVFLDLVEQDSDRFLHVPFLFFFCIYPIHNHLGITCSYRRLIPDLHGSFGWLCRRASLQPDLVISYRLVFFTTNELRCSHTTPYSPFTVYTLAFSLFFPLFFSCFLCSMFALPT